MQFEEQTVTIYDRDNISHTISAIVGVQDDGNPPVLPYYHFIRSVVNNAVEYALWFNLTRLISGLIIGTVADVEDEFIARRWLELVAPLTDWTQPAEVLKSKPAFYAIREKSYATRRVRRKGRR